MVVPDELRFPSACCVGIASQTSLSIFNPTERWLQVAIGVSGLAINGEKVRGQALAPLRAPMVLEYSRTFIMSCVKWNFTTLSLSYHSSQTCRC